MKQRIYLFFASVLLTSLGCAFGQSSILTYKQYMENVKTKNIAYLAQKYDLDIAQADAEAAKIFPDPQLSLGASDNQDHTMHMGRSFDAGLSYTLELGGKRSARVDMAKSQATVTSALLDNYFHQLQADATLAYFAALKSKQLYQVAQMSYNSIDQLAQGDSIRFKLGEIKEIDAQQSRLEAKNNFNDLLQTEGDYKNSLVQVSLMQGDSLMQPIDSLSGKLSYIKRDFDLMKLIATAQNNRADLQAALLSKEVSQQNLRLAKANRALDLGLSVDFAHNMEARNEIAPSPAYNTLTFGISIPLRLSNGNKGAVRAAKFAVEQSEEQYKGVEQQIRSEVVQAYTSYKVTCRQVDAFNTGILADAKNILEKKIYSYKRGDSSLLEVLDAQRTYNDVQQSYCETLYNCVAALIALERASQVWDIEIN